MEKIALVGAGLIGSGWAIVMAEAGHHPVLYDSDPAAPERALRMVDKGLADMRRYGLIAEDPDVIRSRVGCAKTLEEVVDGAVHVQESVPERVEAKRAVFQHLDRLVPPDITLASSTSTIPASSFTEGLQHRERCIVAHPGTPPHLLRLVEIVPAPWTAPAVIEKTRSFMEACRQIPSVLRKEIPGFILNRLQYAILSECYRLWDDGVAGIEDIEKTVREALGLRWSFMGPMETVALNAYRGVPDYHERYGELVYSINATQVARRWDPAALERLEAERLQSRSVKDIAERRDWRDRRLMALLAHKREVAGVEGD
ncbi:MAG: 3-hydroxyacyl-CoA dehydrogenase [Variibacter sp.]|nr:3-hydroxyacyl-CoA dehydrogenase [Variibacter sp.]